MTDIEILAFTDDEGNEFPFEVIDRLTYKGRHYVVLLPAEDVECDEFLIMQAIAVGRGNEEYLTIEDADTLEAVFKMFQEKHKDEYEFR
ncbi:MAG: DUF1292 domain-containing protein [Butyricicoccus sp.]|nr:DUF1292 domain-containing protein [Butyricicoccus sp.]